MQSAQMHNIVSSLTTDLTEGEVKGMKHSSMSADGIEVSAINHQEMRNVPWGAETMGAKYVCDYWTE